MLAFVLPALLHFRRKDRGDASRGAKSNIRGGFLERILLVYQVYMFSEHVSSKDERNIK